MERSGQKREANRWGKGGETKRGTDKSGAKRRYQREERNGVRRLNEGQGGLRAKRDETRDRQAVAGVSHTHYSEVDRQPSPGMAHFPTASPGSFFPASASFVLSAVSQNVVLLALSGRLPLLHISLSFQKLFVAFTGTRRFF